MSKSRRFEGTDTFVELVYQRSITGAWRERRLIYHGETAKG